MSKKISFKKLERLIQEHNTTIHSVAVSSGIRPVALYEWKSGKSNIGADKLLKLAEFFGVPMEYFFE